MAGFTWLRVVCEKKLSCRSCSSCWCLVITFATLTLSMIHFVWLPTLIASTTLSNFHWALKSSQEKIKTMLIQNFAGQTRSIMGIAIVVSIFFCDNAYICNRSKLNAVKCNLMLLTTRSYSLVSGILTCFLWCLASVYSGTACKESSVW